MNYNYDVIKSWDEEKIRDFFENGGGGEGSAPSAVVSADGDDPFAQEMPDEVIWKMNTAKTVAIITLNRPAAKNALDDKITAGLWKAIARVKCTPSMRVVFLTGAGAMFCAGGDPKSFQQTAANAAAMKAAAEKGEVVEEKGPTFADMLAAINTLPVYVVGLANGSAMGGGFGFLSLCDCVIARKTAFFALSEVVELAIRDSARTFKRARPSMPGSLCMTSSQCPPLVR